MRFCEARAILFKCYERSRKQISQLWGPCEARASLCMCGKDLLKPFQPPMRSCEARPGIGARNDCESSFRHCGSPVKLVQACVWDGMT